jgi:predicted glycosyltransferase
MSETRKAGRGGIFFYVQHLLGIGHIVRASRVAQALAEAGFEVTLVTGGTPVKGFPPSGVRHIQLPSVVASTTGFSALADGEGNPVDRAFEETRTGMLIDAYRAASPDAVIIEAFPFGRRQMRFELLPLLAAIKESMPRPILLSSVRDILQENRKAGRDEETLGLIEQHFDGILVHGDQRFVRLEETFPKAGAFADKIFYTGLVAPQKPAPSPDRFDVVVSAGGGAVGAGLIRAAIDARDILADRRRWCVITGPNLPQEDFDRFAATTPSEVRIERFRPDFPSLLVNATLSISQAGYNTVCDLMQTRCRPILVPFAAGGETEQTERAERLVALGLAEVVAEKDLDGDTMAAAIRRADGRPAPETPPFALNGAAQTADIISRLLARKASG